MKNQKHRKRINWQPLIELIVVLATIVGTTVPLYIHTDNKTNEIVREIRAEMRQFQEEIKNFHGRMCAIEERNREKK